MKDRQKQLAASRRCRLKKHVERYGENAGDQRGLHTVVPKGRQHYRWNDGRMLSEHGYVKLRVGTDHPLADPNGYAYEHLVIWVAAGNPRPSRDQLLRHKNEDRADNRLDNLELLPPSIAVPLI